MCVKETKLEVASEWKVFGKKEWERELEQESDRERKTETWTVSRPPKIGFRIIKALSLQSYPLKMLDELF